MGDGIQAAKAGILEVADLFVVNKADRDGADQTVRDLRYMQSLGGRHSEPGHWRPPICKTVASRETDNGIDEVLDEDRASTAQWLESLRRGAPAPRASGPPGRSRPSRSPALRERMGDVHGSAALGSLADAGRRGGDRPLPGRGRAARAALNGHVRRRARRG